MIRDWIAAERRELAGLLDGLSAEQWDAPSLCDGWAVRQVVAHLTMPFRYSAPRLGLRLRAGGRAGSGACPTPSPARMRRGRRRN